MIKYEDLAENKIDYEEIKKVIEYSFKRNIKSKGDIGREFIITLEEYEILTNDFNFVKGYCSEFGYKVEAFYNKAFNPRFYIKFMI